MEMLPATETYVPPYQEIEAKKAAEAERRTFAVDKMPGVEDLKQ